MVFAHIDAMLHDWFRHLPRRQLWVFGMRLKHSVSYLGKRIIGAFVGSSSYIEDMV